MKSECISCKCDHDFILVFNSNQPSIMHRFRCIPVLPITENDVPLFSSLGGAAGGSSGGNIEGRPRLFASD